MRKIILLLTLFALISLGSLWACSGSGGGGSDNPGAKTPPSAPDIGPVNPEPPENDCISIALEELWGRYTLENWTITCADEVITQDDVSYSTGWMCIYPSGQIEQWVNINGTIGYAYGYILSYGCNSIEVMCIISDLELTYFIELYIDPIGSEGGLRLVVTQLMVCAEDICCIEVDEWHFNPDFAERCTGCPSQGLGMHPSIGVGQAIKNIWDELP